MGKAYISSNYNELLSRFKEHLKVKNYSTASITAYSQHLHGFFEYVDKHNITDIRRINRNTLKDYQLNITEHSNNGNKYAVSTIAIKLRAVKRFFEYLEETNHILINPAEYIKEPKKENRLPGTVLTEDEARTILDIPNLSTMTGIRDRTMLEVFYSTGIRLEEMINLTVYDSDLQGGMLRVNKGKCAKDRVIPLGRHAVKFLKEYITRIRPQYTKHNRSIRNLFINRYGKVMSKQVVEIMVRKYVKKTDIKKRVTPHTFRHTFATGLIRNGADIRAVQKMLGHSHLSVTQIYTKVAGVEVKKTHRTSHPREKDKAVKEEIKPDMKNIKRHYRQDRHEHP